MPIIISSIIVVSIITCIVACRLCCCKPGQNVSQPNPPSNTDPEHNTSKPPKHHSKERHHSHSEHNSYNKSHHSHREKLREQLMSPIRRSHSHSHHNHHEQNYHREHIQYPNNPSPEYNKASITHENQNHDSYSPDRARQYEVSKFEIDSPGDQSVRRLNPPTKQNDYYQQQRPMNTNSRRCANRLYEDTPPETIRKMLMSNRKPKFGRFHPNASPQKLNREVVMYFYMIFT